MANASYACISCGASRRANIVPFGRHLPHSRTEAEAKTSADWPKCCGVPMIRLSDAQAEGASRLGKSERLLWLSKGGHVIQQHGRRKWKPAISENEIKEAEQQFAAFRGSMFIPTVGTRPKHRG